MTVHTHLRMRSRVSDSAIKAQIAGKVLGTADYDVLLTGPAAVVKPDGRPLAVYLPEVLREYTAAAEVYDVLHELRTRLSRNRGMASGSKRLKHDGIRRSYTQPIASAVVGAVDPMGQNLYCRLTSWTGRNLPAWQTLHPLLRAVAGHLESQVPQRYAAQLQAAQDSDPAWIVPGTPFSTVTVNNTYPTGVHTDKGDLDAGFSTIACLRRGDYTGGQLVFPAYRVAVDLRDGDLLLMDAHDWHGNCPIVCRCGDRLNGPCEQCGAERISVVSYFRTKITQCGTPQQEYERAVRVRERLERGGSNGQTRQAADTHRAEAAQR